MTTLHLCRGTGKHFRVRMRLPGGRRWYPLSRAFRTKRAAFAALARNLAETPHNRGEVLLCADWYEPLVVLEARKA